MAHLVENGVVNDGSWSLSVLVTDMNIQRTLFVTGQLHIGGLMLKLVDEIDVTRDWSDHALWWPEKRKWLTHTRSTLDQMGITADCNLEFTPQHKLARVQLPDLQMIDARLDFSVNVVKATQQLCREIGIRYSEELSLKRFIPPEMLRKGLGFESDQSGPQPIRPGEESIGPGTLRRQTPISASACNLAAPLRRGTSPSLSTSGQMFNASELGTLPRSGTLPRGVSPGPAAYSGTIGRTPMVPSVSFCEGLENEQYDMALVHSPRIVPNKEMTVFRPQNYVEKAALNRGWLDSSRSLMEQGVFEGDVILLRFKFMTFFDMNPKYDPVRINQLYEQAKWSILLEEYDHTEEEALLFAALQLQATLQRNSPEPDPTERDDVDVLLDELEQNLDAAALSRRSDLTQVPELADYLKYMKPKKLTAFKGFKRAYFSFRDLYLSWHQNSSDISGPPLGHICLKGCEVNPDVSLAQSKFHIKLLIPSAEGMSEFVLKCDTEHQYARWMAACRLASRGKSMADASYQSEVDSIKKLLQMQSGGSAQNGITKKKSPPVQLPPDFNVDEFVSQRYVRRARSKQSLQQRISDAHSNVRSLSSTEAKLQYIRAWEALPEHGTHYFVVRFRNGRKPELIGIAFNRIMKLNIDSGESLKTWRFAAMKKWHVNWEIRHLKIQFENEDIEFKPLSADCKVVHEFIGGYIFLSLRNKEQSQTLNEELFHKLTGGWA
uniref:PH domain-containing protein n=1 Tax=Parascaris univalens TaxID=6257 RepID=A0A915B736_PARUN